ncbi:MAG: FxDxF family PEP-CTERM protein [Rhizobacter sp.]|nr:PEP-CTERM sorting domain-containing protein [Burkholderiaceae bacterium]MCO5122798.1 FxDxF family PEP-CTERM protein [Rhizobacter sp.]
MKFKHLALAAAVAVASSGAWAENNTVDDIDLSSGTAFFGVFHFDDGAFTDTFNFINGPSFADVTASLVTAALINGNQNIDFTSATLDGNALTFSPNGQFEIGVGAWSGLTGPTFQLIVMGTASGTPGSTAASYSGTLNVSPVPEPGTYALLLAGLGAVGFIAKRRKLL